MSRIIRNVALLLSILIFLAPASQAKEIQLNRKDVTVIKKKLVAVEQALNPLPEGYLKSEEDFDLPTSVNEGDKGGFQLVNASADFTFDGGSDKMAKKSQDDIEATYKKKIMEAQAKGDYAAMQKISQEMMQEAMGAQMAAVDAQKEPVRVDIAFNGGAYATIDPDAVVFEKPGVIALKSLQNQGEEMQVMIYFDPVKLKETETLAKVELESDDDPDAPQKTTVRYITIQMTGPPSVVEAWSQSVDTGMVLAQIDH